MDCPNKECQDRKKELERLMKIEEERKMEDEGRRRQEEERMKALKQLNDSVSKLNDSVSEVKHENSAFIAALNKRIDGRSNLNRDTEINKRS